MPTTWYKGIVKKIEKASSTTKRFWLEIEDVEEFEFKAGQFITMDLPVGQKRLQRWRSYSIANAPNRTNLIELCIVKFEDGLASKYLFEDVDIGTCIKFKGPDGTFTLPDESKDDLVFICTGTGVAPFRSMLKDIENGNGNYKNIHLIFGTRYEEGILYREEFEAMEEKYSWFKYSVALSREKDWSSYKGYIHQIYLDEYQDHAENKQFFLCGWTNMIDDAVVNLLTKMNCNRKQIHYELYG